MKRVGNQCYASLSRIKKNKNGKDDDPAQQSEEGNGDGATVAGTIGGLVLGLHDSECDACMRMQHCADTNLNWAWKLSCHAFQGCLINVVAR